MVRESLADEEVPHKPEEGKRSRAGQRFGCDECVSWRNRREGHKAGKEQLALHGEQWLGQALTIHSLLDHRKSFDFHPK